MMNKDDRAIAAGDAIAKAVLGKGFGNGTFLCDLAVKASGNGDTVKEIDKVVMSAYMRNDAVEALQNAEAAYMENPSAETVKRFNGAFRVAQALTAVQYDNMYAYYRRKGDKRANDIASKKQRLDNVSAANYLVKLFHGSDGGGFR